MKGKQIAGAGLIFWRGWRRIHGGEREKGKKKHSLTPNMMHVRGTHCPVTSRDLLNVTLEDSVWWSNNSTCVALRCEAYSYAGAYYAPNKFFFKIIFIKYNL
jgi:hypothetical protein